MFRAEVQAPSRPPERADDMWAAVIPGSRASADLVSQKPSGFDPSRRIGSAKFSSKPTARIERRPSTTMKMIEPQQTNGSGNGHAAARTAVAVNAENLAFVEDLYYQWRTDPSTVDPAWRSYFESLDATSEPAIAPPATFKRSIFGGSATVVPLRP
jgi:hypothetical protein